MTGAPEPRAIFQALLEALGASDGRRRRRKRDTTADAIGLALKRELLAEWELAIAAPSFRAWLLGGARSDDRHG